MVESCNIPRENQGSLYNTKFVLHRQDPDNNSLQLTLIHRQETYYLPYQKAFETMHHTCVHMQLQIKFHYKSLLALHSSSPKKLQHKYSKACVNHSRSKRQKRNGFQSQLSLNVRQKYCRMLKREQRLYQRTETRIPIVSQ